MKRSWLACWVVLGAGTMASSAWGQPAGPVVDEGYTFYDVETHTFMDGDVPSAEWSLKASLRVFGDFAPRSVLKYAIRAGGRAVGEVRCETRETSNRVLREFYPGLFALGCAQRDLHVRALGEVTIAWSLVDGATDAETPLATHTIQVRQAPSVDPGSTPPRPWYPHVYVDRHSELLSTVLWHHPNRAPGAPQGFTRYLPNPRAQHPGASVDVMFNASPEWGASNVTRGANIRCTRDGQPVDLHAPYRRGPMSGERTDEVELSEVQATYAEAVLPNPHGDNPRVIQDHYVFRRYYATLPLTFGPEDEQRPDATALQPGPWECLMRNDRGEPLRVFRWVVDDSGRVAQHAEQAGGLTLAPDAVVIEAAVPAGGVLDHRTDPAATARAWNGRGFRSEAARPWVSAVPAIGQPAPLVAPPGRGRSGRVSSR